MTLPDLPEGKRWWMVLIDIARVAGSVDYGILPQHAEGGITWLGVIASDEDDVMEVVSRELHAFQLKLRLVVEEIQEIIDFDELEEEHPELAANIASWDRERAAVWGVVHSYLAEGEA